MSLSAAMQIARSALTASQVGIQVAGNNMANAATPGYSRQVVRFDPVRGVGDLGGGRGVQVREVRRMIDEALQSRLRHGVSDEAAARQQSFMLSQVEAILGELGDNDLSSELTAYFNAWSERANQTNANGIVIEQGRKLADFIRRTRTALSEQLQQGDRQLGAAVARADSILGKVADLNRAIADAESNGSVAGALRDQRDNALSELAELIDVTVVHRGGSVDVLVGSSPILLGASSRGLELSRVADGDGVRVAVTVRADGQTLSISSGAVGALLDGRAGTIQGTIERLDSLASQLIFQVNRVHSTGISGNGLASNLATLRIASGDRALALNDPANATFAGLPFAPVNGGFNVHVRNSATGQMQTVRIPVDLDGINSAGLPGYGDDTSAEDIRAALDAIPGLSATFNPEGKLRIEAASGMTFHFSEDSSGVLAVLGVNAFFTGRSGLDIGVREELSASPHLLAAGRLVNGEIVENGSALELAALGERTFEALGGRSLQQLWSDSAQVIGSRAAAAKVNAEASEIVRAGLESQRSVVSGVSIDEEAMSLMSYQRQFQGAARLISVTDELMRILISIV